MKPIASLGWFVSDEEDVNFIGDMTLAYTQYVHLCFYERENAVKYYRDCFPYVSRINSIHLPNGLTLKDYKKGGLVPSMQEELNVNLFTVHPWADDLKLIVEEVIANQTYTLCLENFPIKRSQNGNPFYLLAHYGRYMIESEKIGLTLDLAHLDDELANYSVVKGLLPYTKIVHMSCRVKNNAHLPIFTQQSDVNARNLVGLMLNIENLGVEEIVLEYQREYKKQQKAHLRWLRDVIVSKRRKFE